MNSLLKFSILTALAVLTGCNKNSTQQPAQTSAQTSTQTSSVKHYQLKGKVISIDKRGNMANIDAEAIPGFMDAMTMPYPVKPESDLDKLKPGDLVTADVVVTEDNSWLENIAVTGHEDAAKAK
jgi:protein SCO1/2